MKTYKNRFIFSFKITKTWLLSKENKTPIQFKQDSKRFRIIERETYKGQRFSERNTNNIKRTETTTPTRRPPTCHVNCVLSLGYSYIRETKKAREGKKKLLNMSYENGAQERAFMEDDTIFFLFGCFGDIEREA